MKKTKNIKKLMTFDVGLYERVSQKATRVGVNFQDYVKHLLIQDFENSLPIEYASPELAKKIKIGLDEYMKGNYKEVKAGDDKGLDKILGLD